MAERPEQRSDNRPDEFGRRIHRSAERKLRARNQDRRSAWFGLGMFGLVGWSVVIPSLLGIALGIWLDKRFSGPPSWTMTFLIIGVALGCLNAWFWIKQESKRD